MKKTRSTAFQSSPNIDPAKVPPVEAKQRVELIRVQMILDLGTVDPAKYPLPQTRLTLEFLRDYVHLRPRTNTISAIACIRNALAYATYTFFQNDAEKLEKELIKNPRPSEADDDMNCAVAYVRFFCEWLLDNCLDDMEFMVKNLDKSAIDRPRMVSSTKFVRTSYTEAVAILDEALKERQFENIVEWGIDLASDHES
ncbi:hypothetical protein RHSIM_Rhsim05G0030800 [Rhododendron simsii]|uniref:Uncharacterized protein n=1 Tax=Rhododendron simsii TaxID=118357 RepID=A0A834H6L3_RHOSS|nr:hypothetical protein RHSIM_Rhsim05G0030800 [Rhododendron simsii]